MTLDDAASQRQHASDLADSDVVKTERLESYGSIVGLQAAMLAALRAGDHERALVIFGDLTRLAVLAEREACAKVAESVGENDRMPLEWPNRNRRIAREIRARR